MGGAERSGLLDDELATIIGRNILGGSQDNFKDNVQVELDQGYFLV
jgi:hypothetical protein